MSKLPNAPLVEVIFEMRWDVKNVEDVKDFQYLHGDLYANLKNKYPYRENILPLEIPIDMAKWSPAYRFRTKENGYPLIQIGLGIITVNTNDEFYYWDKFKEEVKSILLAFEEIYSKIKNANAIISLLFIDFFEIDFNRSNTIDFVNNNLNLKLEQKFIADENINTKEINMVLNYQIEDDVLLINLYRGGIHNHKNGLILETKIISNSSIYDSAKMIKWLEIAQDKCSTIFKDITKGHLYESFT